MNNIEHEYSFKVSQIEPFTNYCIENGYQKEEETNQTRILYKKEDKTMARITIKEENGLSTAYLDFKDDILSDEVLIERRESLPIIISDIKAAESIIDFLAYRKNKTLIRKRQVYKKDEVTFEIDNYESPDKMYVIAIEGDKFQTDNVYTEIKKELGNYIL